MEKNELIDDLYNILSNNDKKSLEIHYKNYHETRNNIEKNVHLYNLIYNLKYIFKNKEKEIIENEEHIKILNIPNFQKEQIELLFDYYSIDENIDNEEPNLITEFEKIFNNINNKNLDEKEIKYGKYLIIGNECKEVNINEETNYKKENNNLFNLKIDNYINFELPEIDLNDNLSLDDIINLYNKCLIVTRIFPIYLQTSIENNNEKNLENSNKIFNILFSIYSYKNNTDYSIIDEKINEFISNFQNMIIKLKDANIDFNVNPLLNKITKKNNNKNFFIKIPEKIESNINKDEWKIKNKKKEIKSDFQKEFLKKINYNNITSKTINNINVNLNPFKKLQNTSDIIENENNNIINNNENNEEESVESDDIINENVKEENDSKIDKKEEKNLVFYSNKIINNSQKKKSREEFDKLEKEYNEDYSLKYIIDKMKHKVNKNEITFNYELSNSKIKGYTDIKNLYHETDSKIEKGEILTISSILENSRFLSSKIITIVSGMNAENESHEIMFNKTEANIMIDLARTISYENRYFNMLMICGLSYALNCLKIPYTLNLVGDGGVKVRIKNIEEPHNELILQKLYDCYFIKRNITHLPTCLKYFIDNYKPNDDSINSVYYIFTNGLDEELKKYKAWQKNFLTMKKILFLSYF